MTQPLLPLTFGVELEFGIAYLENKSTPLPHPNEAKKILYFPTTEEDWADRPQLYSREDWLDHAISSAAKRSVRHTLRDAGFLVTSYDKDSSMNAEVSLWEVVSDSSINGRFPGPYEWTSMEVRSPAFYFTSGSFQAVVDVCKLLSQTYGLQINSSMGVHVHVGNSDEGFDTKTLKALVAFLWAFEPQLNSLHPERRQNGGWATSMRESSPYSQEYLRTHGCRPHPLSGVIHFLNCKSTVELVKQANYSEEWEQFKFSTYNLQGMYDRAKGISKKKATIEFRQHVGTLNSEAIVNWIKTVVGIVNYIRKVDNSTLLNLLRIVENETWEKLGDGKDDERERVLGPILAESRFTISDLLTEIGLYEPAAYYSNRWTKLPKIPWELTPEQFEHSMRERLSQMSNRVWENLSEEALETGLNNSHLQADCVNDELKRKELEEKAELDELEKESA